MKLAMEEGDDDSSSDEATAEVAAADATDTVADSFMTPQKRTRTPKPTHPNKKSRVASMPDKIKPRRKPPSTSIVHQPADRKLHCLFEGKTCIPLWPQYDMLTKSMYVKVASREEWLVQFAYLRRKIFRKGLDRKDVATMQSAKESNADFCKKILLEFRKVVKEAHASHTKSYECSFPSELTLKFNGCDIYVRSRSRHMHIRADDDLLIWIRKGFQQALDAHLKAESGVLAADSQLIACGEDKVFKTLLASGQKLGVRDKIHWLHGKRTWVLSVRKNTEPVDVYLKENNLVLKVDMSAVGEDFDKQRQQALHDACVAWNELDKSQRYRIKLPSHTEEVEEDEVEHGRSGSGTGFSATSPGTTRQGSSAPISGSVPRGDERHVLRRDRQARCRPESVFGRN
jgi:hypothetical protein